MIKLHTLLTRTLEYLMAAALAVMFIAVLGNVILRYGFNSGLAVSEELARLLFVWLIFIGAVLAMARHAHLGFDLLQRRLPAPLRFACALISHALMLYALWLLWQGSWVQFEIGWRVRSTVMQYPLALMAAAGLFTAFGMACCLLLNLYRLLRGDPQAYLAGAPRLQQEEQA
ncbi:TRAP transporter small permease [Balneatrix alpica]|uniref:TRAP transporter small permease protein n=1 Tax=Balneatrix alpica TaxID=75684 RepID=A0ABV5ZCW8_9GAMM|nr:TRAP transporter small permease [Balneatrix alpica]